jgi:hypothetical protein
MDFLRRNMPGILKATSGVCGLLSAVGVPGAGIIKAGADFLSGYVGGGSGGGSGGGGMVQGAAMGALAGQMQAMQGWQSQTSFWRKSIDFVSC